MSNEFFNYFSTKEKQGFKKFAQNRTNILKPLLNILDKLKITPDMISILGLLSVFIFVYFIQKNLIWAGVFMILHIVLDGIDGSLARYKNQASQKGALMDIAVDQGGIIIAVLGFIYFGLVDSFWASLYIIAYTLMIGFVIILNTFNKSPKYIFRSKYLVYVIFFIDQYFQTNLLNPFILIVSVYMTITSIYLFNKIRWAV